jgi:hypothetical protein
MPIDRAPRASLSLAFLALACSACIHADFVSSSPSFVTHETAELPVVYFDHLPDRPYASVGIIDVIAPAGSKLEEVFAAAADKGKEIGCDVVVDRSIHRIADAALPRWRVTVLGSLGPPPPRAAPGDARLLGYGPTLAPVVILSPPPPPPPPVIYSSGYSPPPDRREFICGVWAAQAPAATVPAAPPSGT